jgi:hypothetical protein
VHFRTTRYTDSSEHEFLLNVLSDSNQIPREELCTQVEQIDWQLMFAILPPDLYGYFGYRLTELGLESQCPSLLFEETLNARRATLAQWLRFRLELRRLASEFADHNVDFLLLKGAVLAFKAYPDSSLRSVSDIDVLVRTENLDKTLERVYAAGFRRPDRYANADHHAEFALPGEQISLPLEKLGTRALIEVHTQLESCEPWFPVPTSRVWETSELTDLNGLEVRIPDRHEFLFHLILHLARAHLFALGLRPLLDVHLWVESQRERLDWEWIASECLHRKYGDWVYLTLRIASEIFRTPVPVVFFERVAAPAAFDHLRGLATEQIWADRRLDSLVPPRLVMCLSEQSVTRAASILLRRFKTNRLQIHATIPPSNIVMRAGVVASSRRILGDAGLKIPLYLRAWRNGKLRWSSLRKAVHLSRGRMEIKRTILDSSTSELMFDRAGHIME